MRMKLHCCNNNRHYIDTEYNWNNNEQPITGIIFTNLFNARLPWSLSTFFYLYHNNTTEYNKIYERLLGYDWRIE